MGIHWRHHIAAVAAYVPLAVPWPLPSGHPAGGRKEEERKRRREKEKLKGPMAWKGGVDQQAAWRIQ